MNVFEYDDYNKFFSDLLADKGKERGFQSKLAKAAQVHPSFLSRVFNQSTHLTPDQAAGICEYLSFDRDETAYFINLVHLARAGTNTLKNLIQNDLQELRGKREELKNLLSAEETETSNFDIYYTAWYFSAVHMITLIPEFRTEKKIASRLGLSLEATKSILNTLKALDLVRSDNGKWTPSKTNVHRPDSNYMAGVHHLNWRMKLSEKIQLRTPRELHYTGVHILSQSDYEKIKGSIRKMLTEVDRTVRKSDEEEIVCLSVDFAKI